MDNCEDCVNNGSNRVIIVNGINNNNNNCYEHS